MTEPRDLPADQAWLEVEGEGDHGWLTAARVVEAIRRIGETGATVRTEPIKLTPDQWALIPHGAPNRYGPLTPAGDLLGVPVFMVADESEPTPVVEGWVKGPSKPTHKLRWWHRLWRRSR